MPGPWDESKTDQSWREIKHAVYTTEELLASVHEIPQVLDQPGVKLDNDGYVEPTDLAPLDPINPSEPKNSYQ